MKKLKTDRRPGFARLLINNYLILTLVMALAIVSLQWITNSLLNRALEPFDYAGFIRQVQLAPGDDLPAGLLKRHLGDKPYLQLYDASGQLIFATPEAQHQPLSGDLIELLPTPGDTSLLQNMSYTGPDGQPQHLLVIDSPDGSQSGFFRLDADYQVIEASPDTPHRLTPDEMRLVFREDNELFQLVKLSYTNRAGDSRLMVLRDPSADEARYRAALNWWRYSWLILAAIYVGLVGLSVWWLNRKTTRLLRPLSDSVEQMISRQPIQIDYQGPGEFVALYDQFNQLSAKLQHSEAERQKLDANRNKMLADISHDLKTPITVIQGYAQAIHQQLIPPPQQAKYLETIYQKSLHLNQLIDKFFAYSQLHHPHLILYPEPHPLAAYMQTYLAEKYQEIELAGCKLEVSLPEDDDLSYPIDPIQWRRVWDNLLANCLKYNPPGTTIFFRMSFGHDIVIDLADDGVGLPEHLKDKLFEPFMVGDEARGQNGGTGLGLAITQRIIQLHGGEIKLVHPADPPYRTQFQIRFAKPQPDKGV